MGWVFGWVGLSPRTAHCFFVGSRLIVGSIALTAVWISVHCRVDHVSELIRCHKTNTKAGAGHSASRPQKMHMALVREWQTTKNGRTWPQALRKISPPASTHTDCRSTFWMQKQRMWRRKRRKRKAATRYPPGRMAPYRRFCITWEKLSLIFAQVVDNRLLEVLADPSHSWEKLQVIGRTARLAQGHHQGLRQLTNLFSLMVTSRRSSV